MASFYLWQPEALHHYAAYLLFNIHTAVCIDPAKYLRKPKSANLKVVQMNLIMWLTRLGFHDWSHF